MNISTTSPYCVEGAFVRSLKEIFCVAITQGRDVGRT